MSAWGGPPSSGAWANQVDEEEEENGGELDPVPVPSATAFPALGGETAFPALGESINIKDSKKDRKQKKVKNTMPLGAFVAAGRKEPEIVNLPTGPRQRSAEEEEKRGGLGGGFRNYGGDRGGGGFDRRERDDEGGFGGREDEGPSRADAADDWGTKKAFVPSGPSRGGGFSDRDRGGGFGDRERGGGFGDRDRGGGFGDRYSERRSGLGEGSLDRADTADKWGSKTFEPSPSPSGRVGFGDRDRMPSDRSRDGDLGFSRADTEDKWSRRSPATDSLDAPSSTGPSSRPRLALKPRSSELPPLQQAPTPADTPSAPAEPLVVPRTGPRANPFGDAKPKDIKERAEPPLTPEKETSVDASPETQADSKPAQPRPRANPFGSARPREEVLKEKAGSQLPAVAEGSPAVAEGSPLEEEESPAVAAEPAAVAGEGASKSQAVQTPAEQHPGKQGVEVKLEEPVEDSTTTSSVAVGNEKDSKQGIASKEAIDDEPQVEALTKDLDSKVKVEHSEPQKQHYEPAEKSEPPAAGSWAKIAAASKSVEGSAKGIEA